MILENALFPNSFLRIAIETAYLNRNIYLVKFLANNFNLVLPILQFFLFLNFAGTRPEPEQEYISVP